MHGKMTVEFIIYSLNSKANHYNFKVGYHGDYLTTPSFWKTKHGPTIKFDKEVIDEWNWTDHLRMLVGIVAFLSINDQLSVRVA